MGKMPKTRLDRLVRLKERSAQGALANLAHARSSLGRAQQRRMGALAAARNDGRAPGEAALWVLEEAVHHRALQALKAAEGQLSAAADGERSALDAYGAAHRQADVVRRVAERRRAELARERERTDRRGLDELATLRFNHGT